MLGLSPQPTGYKKYAARIEAGLTHKRLSLSIREYSAQVNVAVSG
jgi:hypothetical protein